MTCFKRGESLFIPFVEGLGVPNSQGRTRMYKSMANLEKLMPKDCDKYEAVEYAEVKRGEWILSSDGYYPFCSNCRYEPPFVGGKDMRTPYCPNCGAKMDGGKE